MPVNDTAIVLNSVFEERMRQIEKWGQQRHTIGYWLGITAEEDGEFSKEYIERQEGQLHRMREELIQAIAVRVALAEHLDELLQQGNKVLPENLQGILSPDFNPIPRS